MRKLPAPGAVVTCPVKRPLSLMKLNIPVVKGYDVITGDKIGKRRKK